MKASSGKLHDPQEVELVGVGHQLEDFRHAQPDAAQHLADDFLFVRAEENEIALLDAEFFGERRLFLGAEEFDDGRLPFAVLDLDEGETLGAVGLRHLGQFLDLARW